MSSSYNFVRFTGRGSKLSNYKISINKSGSLGLLSGFYSKENIKNYQKAILFFDRAKKIIGISFTNDLNADGAFKITHNKTHGSSGSITAHSFFVGNDLTQSDYFGQKTPRKEKDDKLGTLYVLDLLEK